MSLSGAGDAALDRVTLRGLSAVNVVIDPLPPEIVRAGATADGLRTRLEQRLRDAGIQIDATRNEFVALRVSAVRAARGPVAISISVSLYQPVILARDRDVRTATQTWEVDGMALADTSLVSRACSETLEDLAGQFVEAFRAVNPERKEPVKGK
jgi:hypothetical protein